MSKSTAYEGLLNEVKSFIQDENDKIACMANVAALIHERFGFWWTGFYIVKGGQLVLGPFQGPVACTRIGSGKGVCGTSWSRRETIVVPNVHEFPGHIACSSLSSICCRNLMSNVAPELKNSFCCFTMFMIFSVDVFSMSGFRIFSCNPPHPAAMCRGTS
mgnify:CR=1 FL=1